MVNQALSLYNEAFSIINNSPAQPQYLTEIIIHTQKGDITPLQVIGQVLEQDFVGTIFDNNRVELYLTRSVYMLKLFPNRDNLIITVKETEISPITRLPTANPEIKVKQYKGILERPEDLNLITSGVMGKDTSVIDQTDLMQIVLTLQDVALAPLKAYTLQDIVRDTPTKSFLRSKMGAPKEIKGVHVVEPTGDNHIEYMVIPKGIGLIELPAWVDKNEQGIYTTGLGYYLKDSFWYIYPLFNTSRVDDPNEHTLTIINVPSERFSHVETTFGRNGNTVYILNSGKLSFHDLGEQVEINDGNGVIYGVSNSLSANTTLDNKTNTPLFNSGFKQKGLQKESKANEISLAKYSKGGTTNHARMMSELNSTTGTIVSLGWENSNPDVLYPAMPVRLLYQEDEVVKEMIGVLSGISTEKRNPISGNANQALSCNSVLTLRLKRKNEK